MWVWLVCREIEYRSQMQSVFASAGLLVVLMEVVEWSELMTRLKAAFWVGSQRHGQWAARQRSCVALNHSRRAKEVSGTQGGRLDPPSPAQTAIKKWPKLPHT